MLWHPEIEMSRMWHKTFPLQFKGKKPGFISKEDYAFVALGYACVTLKIAMRKFQKHN